MKRVNIALFFCVLVISLCCYGDVQSDFEQAFQSMERQNYTYAKNLYQAIANDGSGDFISKSQMRIEWIKAFELIASADYAQSQNEISNLKAKYSTNSDLPEMIYRAAERYKWKMQYGSAADLYQQVINQYPESTFKQNAQLGLLSVNTQALLKAEDFEQAKIKVNEIISNYSSNEKFPEVLSSISEAYTWKAKLSQALELCKYIIDNNPSYRNLAKVQLDYDWIEACLLLKSEDYEGAEVFVNKVKNSSLNEEHLAKGLFNIAERYRWSNKISESKELYQRVMLVAGSEYASKAAWHELWINVFDLIKQGDFDLADSRINEAISQFGGTEELAEMLFRAGERYRWITKYDNALDLYSQSQQASSSGRWAQESKFSNLQVRTLLALRSGDYDSAQSLTNSLIADFSNHERMAQVLMSIAERYRWAGNYSKVDAIYKEIISTYSSSKEASKASLDSTIVNTLALISPDNIGDSETAIDTLLAELSDDPRLPDTMVLAGEKYYLEGLKLEKSNQYNQSESYYQKALAIRESLLSKFPDKTFDKSFYSWAGDCYNRVGNFNESLTCYQNLSNYYPEDNWHALFMIGRISEKLSKLEPDDQHKARAKYAYEAIVNNYPQCGVVAYAKSWLNKSE